MAEAPKKPPWLAKYWQIWVTVVLAIVLFALEGWRRYAASHRGSSIVVTAHGETLVYTTSLWPMIPLAIPTAAALVLVVHFLRQADTPRRAMGVVLLLIVVLMMGSLVPALLRWSLVLDPDGFTSTSGFWWQPTTKSVRFDQGTAITLDREEDGLGGVRDVLEWHKGGGEVVSMPLGDDLIAALPAIRQRARTRGVVLEDLRLLGMPPGKAREGTPWLVLAAVVALPVLLLVGLVAFVYGWMRLQPVNRMGRLLWADDANGAIRIGESIPPARRDLGTRCNLAIAYKRAGREAEALAHLAEIEAEPWTPSLGPEEQYRKVLEQLHKIIDAAPEVPETPPAD